MKKSDIRKANIIGNNIYREKNRLIYYDTWTKKAHQIGKGDEKTYVYFQAGIPAACLVAALIAYFTRNNILALAVGLGFAVTVYLVFRLFFIAHLPEYPQFQLPEKTGFLDKIAANNTYKLITTVLVMTALAVLVLVNARMQDYDQLTDALNYFISGAFLVLAFINLLALIKKLRS